MTRFHNFRAKTLDFLWLVYFGPSHKFSSSVSTSKANIDFSWNFPIYFLESDNRNKVTDWDTETRQDSVDRSVLLYNQAHKKPGSNEMEFTPFFVVMSVICQVRLYSLLRLVLLKTFVCFDFKCWIACNFFPTLCLWLQVVQRVQRMTIRVHLSFNH